MYHVQQKFYTRQLCTDGADTKMAGHLLDNALCFNVRSEIMIKKNSIWFEVFRFRKWSISLSNCLAKHIFSISSSLAASMKLDIVSNMDQIYYCKLHLPFIQWSIVLCEKVKFIYEKRVSSSVLSLQSTHCNIRDSLPVSNMVTSPTLR